MKCIQKKLLSLSWIYKKLFFIIIPCFFSFQGISEETTAWSDIQLSQKFNHIEFGSNLSDSNITNLFDLDLNSNYCFINSEAKIFIKATDLTNQKLRILANLNFEESLEIEVSIYYGINPDGYVSEFSSSIYKSQKSDLKQIIKITNQNEFQDFDINFNNTELDEFRNQVIKKYKSEINIPQQDACFIIQLNFKSKAKQVCISEILLNNNLYIFQKPNQAKITEIYLNSEENTVIAEKNEENILIYQDTSSILQIMETTENNKFAIINSLPKNTEGRAESNYLLLDIENKKILNSRIQEIDKTYVNGAEIYFEQTARSLILNYLNDNMQYSKILIIGIKL